LLLDSHIKQISKTSFFHLRNIAKIRKVLYPPRCTVQCIPTKLVLFVSCIYHRMSVYILCTSTKCRLCTTPVVSFPLLPHNPPPSPLPISTRPTSSRWVPPYVPWFCLRFLPD